MAAIKATVDELKSSEDVVKEEVDGLNKEVDDILKKLGELLDANAVVEGILESPIWETLKSPKIWSQPEMMTPK